MSLTKNELLKRTGALQKMLDASQRKLDEIREENGRVRECLENAINMAHDAQNRLNGVRGELAVTQSKLTDLERRVTGFLDKEQSEVVRVMGISPVDYAINHLKDLHNHRQLIELTRDYRSH